MFFNFFNKSGNAAAAAGSRGMTVAPQAPVSSVALCAMELQKPGHAQPGIAIEMHHAGGIDVWASERIRRKQSGAVEIDVVGQ
jgi:hypothetical protein